ncbi:MAG: hypothetical protein GY861_27805, partial [bacterium]|nr:hypothetical protein [bacterium]
NVNNNASNAKISDDNPLLEVISRLFCDGFKVPDDRALNIVQALDTYHWTKDNALIIVFTRRMDLCYIKSLWKNLAEYKPHDTLISIKDDLEPGQLASEKECRAKFKALKSGNPNKTYKIVPFNRIACDNVVKLFHEW